VNAISGLCKLAGKSDVVFVTAHQLLLFGIQYIFRIAQLGLQKLSLLLKMPMILLFLFFGRSPKML